jgi:hypothetical protein
VDESTEWLLKFKDNDKGPNRNGEWKFGRYRLYREALEASAPRDPRWRKACRKFINIELTTKMTRAGKQIFPAESYYPYVMIWLIMHPGCIAIHHVHTHQSGGCSVRSFVGILNQSKPDLWNAVVVFRKKLGKQVPEPSPREHKRGTHLPWW